MPIRYLMMQPCLQGPRRGFAISFPGLTAECACWDGEIQSGKSMLTLHQASRYNVQRGNKNLHGHHDLYRL